MKKSMLTVLMVAAFLTIQGCASTQDDVADREQPLSNKEFADRISATCAGYGKAARDNGGEFAEVFNDCMNHAVSVIEDQANN